MKLELNPNKMTVEELTDAINELSAQRARIVEEKRQSVETALTLEMVAFLRDVNESNYECQLVVRTKGNRQYRVPLNIEAIGCWSLSVQPKKEKEEED